MSKITMNLEIMKALQFFNINTEHYSTLVAHYGSAEKLHEVLGEAFEEQNIVDEMISVIESEK